VDEVSLTVQESLERFSNAGLVLSTAPTRLPPGAGVVAQNVWFGRQGSLNSRPGYRRFLEVSMSAPVSMVTQFLGQVIIVGGVLVDVEGTHSCE